MLCSHSDNKYLPPVRLEREWKMEPMEVNRKCTPPPRSQGQGVCIGELTLYLPVKAEGDLSDFSTPYI